MIGLVLEFKGQLALVQIVRSSAGSKKIALLLRWIQRGFGFVPLPGTVNKKQNVRKNTYNPQQHTHLLLVTWRRKGVSLSCIGFFNTLPSLV